MAKYEDGPVFPAEQGCQLPEALHSPILLLHVSGGILGFVSGAAASLFRKGARRHTLAGQVFVASMLTMALGATWLAIQKHESGNIGGGILTFYMILTAWLTARRRWRDNEQI